MLYFYKSKMMGLNRKLLLLFLTLFIQSFSLFAQFAPEKIKGGLFVENKGQWNNSVLYRSEIPSGQLYIEKDRFLFNFYDQEAMARHHHGQSTSGDKSSEKSLANNKPKPTLINAHSYEVAFVGCTPISSTESVNPTSYNYNYFKGTDKNSWASNAKGYSKTILNNIYPNTSLACLAQETGFKYEFYLNPGANPNVIKLEYSGVDSLYLKNGELFIQTSINSFYEQRPYAYQDIDGRRIVVPCDFRLDGHLLSFVFPGAIQQHMIPMATHIWLASLLIKATQQHLVPIKFNTTGLKKALILALE